MTDTDRRTEPEPSPMPETETTPALTPEEWEHPSNAREIGWACSEVFVGEGSSLDNVTRHGLAALCLYGQPYGFTWEDVDRVNTVADHFQRAIDHPPHTDDWHQSIHASGLTAKEFFARQIAKDVTPWRSLADRLAALLPPR